METLFENIKFNDLTEEQLNQLTEKEIVDKALGEYAEEINLHVEGIKFCKKNIAGGSLLFFLTTLMFGFLYTLIPLGFIIFNAFYLRRMKKSIVWHVRSFKSTASLYIQIGYELYVMPHVDRVDKSVYLVNYIN